MDQRELFENKGDFIARISPHEFLTTKLEAMKKFKLKEGTIITENQEEERKIGSKRVRAC